MQKITSNILIVATVIAMLPLQSLALNEQTATTNIYKTDSSRNIIDSGIPKFWNDKERTDFIRNKFKEVRKKNMNDSIDEKNPKIREEKIRTLVESFHNRKKDRKEIIVTATGNLESIRSYLGNIDETISVKPIGNNLYSITFQNGKSLDISYFQNMDTGVIPEKLFDYPIVQPVLMNIDAVIDPSLNGESIQNLWGMTKMETTNYQSGLSLQPNPTTIAIIDTGVDRFHKDLAKNTWINTKEIGGNGIDDDGNGYTDDVNGYDFVNKDTDPIDDNGHGTHVSGSAAGSVNGSGVFGVDSSARLLGLKVLSANGAGSSYDVYKAIYYAADNGARVINMSLGGAGTPSSDPVCAAIDYAKSKWAITVVAAGNSNVDASTQVPAGCANAITVGAVDSALTKASFSNYGAKLDVAAPGVSIYSSTPGNAYQTWAGTSMATPYVAGLVSAIKKYRPGLSTDDIKILLKNTALTEAVNSTVNIGRFPNMAKIFANLGIVPDSELNNPAPTPAPVTDANPPNTTIAPTVSLTTETGTTLSVGIDEIGTGYYLVQSQTSAAPTIATILAANNSFAMNANVAMSMKITGLSASTGYTIWFAAKDTAWNLQTTAMSVSFTTNAPVTVPKPNIAPTITYTAKLVSKNTYDLTITGNDTDGTIARYEVYLNGQLFNTLPKTTVRISGWNVTTYAKVYDNLGASATSKSIILRYKR